MKPVFLLRAGSIWRASFAFSMANAWSIFPVICTSSGRHVWPKQFHRFWPSFESFGWHHTYAKKNHTSGKDALSIEEAMHLLSQHLVPKAFHKSAAPGRWLRNSPQPWHNPCCENLSSLDIRMPSFLLSMAIQGIICMPATAKAFTTKSWRRCMAWSLVLAFKARFFIVHKSNTKKPLLSTVWSDHCTDLPSICWDPL